ncbi:acyltransferase family protein [Pediococcus pentosaceus]|uniref:acyltransferase family protein n=1 Tax=Pediococcus pentosaceus TaxID=1255 RepID=UPI001303DA2F|nr:acyltransferase family protein [Pediococcus pentosaceus]QGZ69860.1 acyltransferase family protein [Pediococcus pentosaceus]
MSKRIKWIDFGKGITILLVVIGHVSLGLFLSNRFNTNASLLLLLIEILYVFHMPVFFALSGYFFKTINSANEYIYLLKKKFISLGIPYVAFSVIMTIMKKIGGGSVRTPVGITKFINIYRLPIDHLWFLYVLFGIFVYLGFLSLYIKNDKILFNISLIGYLIITIFPTDIYLIQRVLIWSPMFMLGKILRDVKLKSYITYITISGYVIYLILWMVFNFKTQISYSTPGIQGIIFPISIFFAFSVYSSINENSNFFEYFVKCGRISLPIYLMHAPIASIIRIILLKVGVTQVFVQLFIGVIGAWFISILIFEIIHQIKFLDFFLYPMKYLKQKSN